LLLEREIKAICVLNGGIQAVKLDAPDLLQEKQKATQLSQLLKEVKMA
jgi:hypothetical protein